MNTIKKRSRKRDDAVFPTVTLSVAMETSGRIWPNFELIQTLMHALIICKYEKDPINQKTNGPVNAHLISGPRISTKRTQLGKNKAKK